MEIMRSKLASAILFALVTGLLTQNLVVSATSTRTEDQKTYYSPDPHAGTPPTGSHNSPAHGTPPSHGSGGGYGGTPPSNQNCGTPPHGHTPTPSTPSNPPSGGGGYSSPPSGGGGYSSPPSSGGGSPPTTPITDPGTPSTPTAPFTGTCNFWRSHPGMIWGVVGWWGTLGNAFGATNVPGFGANLNLLQALSNTRTDGFGALYREGTASYLNSLVNDRFPFTTKQVRDSFVAALSSNGAAADQAKVFKLANEGKIKHKA